MSDICIRKDSIEEKEKKNPLKVSWSKLRQYGECPASWFCINYADIVNVEYVQINQTKAIPGTIVQKLFEVFVNERIYMRGDMKKYEDLLNWFNVNSKALFKLIARPLEDQNLSRFRNIRSYFKRVMGKKDLVNIQNTYGLDECIKPSQITFVDWGMLNEEYGSTEINGEDGFLKYLEGLYKPILELFIERKINLNYMFSEAYIETKVNNIKLNGYVDFIYNKNQIGGVFNNLKQIGEEFVVLDGKIRISKFVHKEQLLFYATLLYLKYKKRPSYVGFIDWSKPRFSMYEFDFGYFDVLKQKIVEIQDTYVKVKDILNRCGDDQIQLKDIDLKYNSSSGCVFCPIVLVCESALARKEELKKFILAMKNKEKTKKYLKEMGVDKNQSTQDIKL